MICQGSGFVMGGYIEAHRTTTIKVTCVTCWRQVDAAPIEPEWRTDLRMDGQPVEVTRKKIVEHEFGNKYLMLWRRDNHLWMFRLSIVLFAASAIQTPLGWTGFGLILSGYTLVSILITLYIRRKLSTSNTSSEN